MVLCATAKLSQPINIAKRARAHTTHHTTVVFFKTGMKPLNCQKNAFDLLLKVREAFLNLLEGIVGTNDRGWCRCAPGGTAGDEG